MFFLKEKAVELFAYTDNPNLMKFFSVKKATDLMPSYYKTMPSKTPHDAVHPVDNSQNYFSNLKSCYGINQFNLNGYILPLWSDYSILSYNGGVNCIGVNPESCGAHNPRQSEGVLDNFHVVKLMSPWVFRCEKNINFLGAQNFYSINSTDWCIPPGFYNFTYQTQSHIFVLINKKLDKEIFLKAGSPILRLLPMTDKKVNLRVEFVDNLNKYTLNPKTFYFKNGLISLKKRFEREPNAT